MMSRWRNYGICSIRFSSVRQRGLEGIVVWLRFQEFCCSSFIVDKLIIFGESMVPCHENYLFCLRFSLKHRRSKKNFNGKLMMCINQFFFFIESVTWAKWHLKTFKSSLKAFLQFFSPLTGNEMTFWKWAWSKKSECTNQSGFSRKVHKTPFNIAMVPPNNEFHRWNLRKSVSNVDRVWRLSHTHLIESRHMLLFVNHLLFIFFFLNGCFAIHDKCYLW